jgi:hypothetical protein
MTTKHTPTPWYCIDGDIFHKMDRIGTTEHFTNSKAEDFANAKIMAAAPDLLEALQLVMSWIDNWSPNFSDDEEWIADESKIKATITKALGVKNDN